MCEELAVADMTTRWAYGCDLRTRRLARASFALDEGEQKAIKIYVAGAVTLVSVAISVCSMVEPETPESCVERFNKLPANGPVLREARFRPIFTYDTTRMDGGLEELIPEGDRTGLRITVSHGANDDVVKALYGADVPPKGAVFAADNFSLFRQIGTPGSLNETILAGCRATPYKARLVHIQWNLMSKTRED